jgi:hypothetical protein
MRAPFQEKRKKYDKNSTHVMVSQRFQQCLESFLSYWQRQYVQVCKRQSKSLTSCSEGHTMFSRLYNTMWVILFRFLSKHQLRNLCSTRWHFPDDRQLSYFLSFGVFLSQSFIFPLSFSYICFFFSNCLRFSLYFCVPWVQLLLN